MNIESKDDVFAAVDRMDALLDRNCDYLKISYFSMTVKRRLADMQTIRSALQRVRWTDDQPASEAHKTPKVSLLEKAQERNRAAEKFTRELSSCFSSFSLISDSYGFQTLVDLLVIPGAILTDGIVGVYPAYSSAQEIVSQLPSGDRWNRYLRVAT